MGLTSGRSLGSWSSGNSGLVVLFCCRWLVVLFVQLSGGWSVHLGLGTVGDRPHDADPPASASAARGRPWPLRTPARCLEQLRSYPLPSRLGSHVTTHFARIRSLSLTCPRPRVMQLGTYINLVGWHSCVSGGPRQRASCFSASAA